MFSGRDAPCGSAPFHIRALLRSSRCIGLLRCSFPASSSPLLRTPLYQRRNTTSKKRDIKSNQFWGNQKNKVKNKVQSKVKTGLFYGPARGSGSQCTVPPAAPAGNPRRLGRARPPRGAGCPPGGAAAARARARQGQYIPTETAMSPHGGLSTPCTGAGTAPAASPEPFPPRRCAPQSGGSRGALAFPQAAMALSLPSASPPCPTLPYCGYCTRL